jgi:hypothetical protein
LTRDPEAVAAWGPLRHRQSERGSALMLIPAAFLIVMILTLFTLNSALVFLAQQELSRAAAAAANDASSGMTAGTFYDGTGFMLDGGVADSFGQANVIERTGDSVSGLAVSVRRIDEVTIEATATGRPRTTSWALLPWASDVLTVRARATAVHR